MMTRRDCAVNRLGWVQFITGPSQFQRFAPLLALLEINIVMLASHHG
jgi:hypothetical protein